MTLARSLTAAGAALLGCLALACSATLRQDRAADGAPLDRDGAAADRGDGAPAGDAPPAADADPGADGAPVADAGPPRTASFTPSTADFPNPERGFYAFISDLAEVTSAELRYVRDDKQLRLAYSPTTLGAYLAGPLPQSYLDGLSAKLALFRAEGVKLVLRFAYNYDAGGVDAPLAVVQQHVAQLAPLLQDNADVIAYLQAGFIGAWGEWHSSSSGLTSDADKAAIRDALLAAAPAELAVEFRYLPDMIKWYPTVLAASQAFDGSAQSRIAFHNDCFMSSDTDVGTYSSNAATQAQQRAYAKALTAHVPFGGETCDAADAAQQRRSCAAILGEGRDYHLAYLNVGYYQAFHDQWRAEGCYDEVSRTLGYRLQLDSLAHPAHAAPGTAVTVRVQLRNVGWARIFSARTLVLTLRHRSSGAELVGRSAQALRALPAQATASTALDVSVAIPADAAAGDYDVLLSAPDAHPTIAADPRFAVRFANADDAAAQQAWDATRARFAAGTTLAVP